MAPTSAPPPPGTGNAKYVLVALLLLLGIGGIAAWKLTRKPQEIVQIPTVVPPPPSAEASAPIDRIVEEIPPPPPVEEKPEAGPQRPTTVAVAGGGGCAGKCTGTAPPELESALQVRAAQARRCYNNALAQDPSLKGSMSINVRIAPNGQVCSASIANNSMGTSVVAGCVLNAFRSGGGFPAPKGGCVDANIPMKFVPQGQL